MAAMDAGHAIPEDVTPPELPDECVFAYSAFAELMSTRGIGMDIGPIPWTAIDAYACRYNLFDLDEFERFVRLIRAMETVKHAKS